MGKKIVIKLRGEWLKEIREFVEGEELYTLGDDHDPCVVEIDEGEWEFMEKVQGLTRAFQSRLRSLMEKEKKKGAWGNQKK